MKLHSHFLIPIDKFDNVVELLMQKKKKRNKQNTSQKAFSILNLLCERRAINVRTLMESMPFW